MVKVLFYPVGILIFRIVILHAVFADVQKRATLKLAENEKVEATTKINFLKGTVYRTSKDW